MEAAWPASPPTSRKCSSRTASRSHEHMSDPATVRIVKRPLRVLLFAGGPSHEYQFVSTLFVREVDKSRAELSIYLQPAPGQVTAPAGHRAGRAARAPADRVPEPLQDDAGQAGREALQPGRTT